MSERKAAANRAAANAEVLNTLPFSDDTDLDHKRGLIGRGRGQITNANQPETLIRVVMAAILLPHGHEPGLRTDGAPVPA